MRLLLHLSVRPAQLPCRRRLPTLKRLLNLTTAHVHRGTIHNITVIIPGTGTNTETDIDTTTRHETDVATAMMDRDMTHELVRPGSSGSPEREDGTMLEIGLCLLRSVHP